MDDKKAIIEALGVENAFGYHVEAPRWPSYAIAVRDHPPAAWYPCLDAMGRYSGCLGARCPLEMCWTGTQTVSYALALRRRFAAGDADYAPGARCPCCRHLEETTVPALDRQRGLVHLPMLHCGKGHWIHPITAGAVARRRIPAREPLDPAHCGHFDRAEHPHPAVEEHRLRTNRLARERRRAGELAEAPGTEVPWPEHTD